MILIFSSLHLWWIMMSYAFISLTPVWCEINVFLFFLFVFFYCFFVLLCYLLFIFVYSFYLFFSNTIRPRTNIQKI